MSEGAPRNLLAEWAFLLVDSFAQAGVRHVVISPGSRSTPFVLAAAAHPDLRCHDVVDERAAAFFALGLARATGTPPLLLCTSGTAGAHYLPAIIEAGAAYVPLLVLTADRPFELQGCAAPQTIDQVKLYGDHARAYLELGLPDDSDGALRALRRAAAQAVHLANDPVPGAVHLNARARKPLEPPRPDDESETERALRARVRTLAATPLSRAYAPRSVPDEHGIEAIAAACRSAKRGLVVAGPASLAQRGAVDAVRALTEATGFPLLAEASSQLRIPGVTPLLVDAFDTLLRSRRAREALRPDVVIQLGAPPVSSGWEQLLGQSSSASSASSASSPASPSSNDSMAPRRFVVAEHGWNDPRGDAHGLVYASVADGAAAIASRLAGHAPDSAHWQATWERAQAAAWRATAEAALASPGLSEALAVRTLARSLPERGVLVAGNSLAIRHLDTFCPASELTVPVMSQRGASGIDGLVAGAAGAVVGLGRPVTLLLGDVSLLHDVGGLALAGALAQTPGSAPLVIVVLHNGGGRIFEQLPIARAVEERDLAHFTTPHAVRFEHAAALYGCRYALATSEATLAAALTKAHGSPGCTLVEVPVPASGAVAMMQLLQGKLDQQLGREGSLS